MQDNPQQLRQCADTVLMVKPKTFGANAQTAATNKFQQTEFHHLQPEKEINERANQEFDDLVQQLNNSGVRVILEAEPLGCSSPDAVFPNNWISFHHNNKVVIYPMLAANRRSEINDIWLNVGKSHWGIQIDSVLDLRTIASDTEFLEGTGSIVFDHSKRKMYGCRSQRTNPSLFQLFAEKLQYTPILFGATDQQGQPIYHTNVMMSIGKTFVIVCFNSVTDKAEQAMLRKELLCPGRIIIEIDFIQLNKYCGNVLQLMNKDGKLVTAMSKSAQKSFTTEQLKVLCSQSEVLVCEIPTIEQYGGGSVRCMIAEVFCGIS